MPLRPLAPQLLVLLLALVLAALSGASSFAALLAAYAVAWVVMNVAVARGASIPKLDRPRTVLLVLAIAAAPAAMVIGRLDAIAEAEALVGLDVHLADRLRLERSVSIHPALVTSDRPQLFFVRAEGASRMRIVLAPGIDRIDAEHLGHGVFRVDYDPRVSGAPERGGVVQARLEIDGSVTELELESVGPLAHPRWLRVSPDRARACTTSEETDELVVIDGQRLVARIPTGDGPSDCAFVANDRIAVSFRFADTLALHGVADDEPPSVHEIELGRRAAHRIAASERDPRLAVAHEDGSITVVDALTTAVIARGAVGGLADWIAWDGDAVIVARRSPAALLRLVIDGAALRLERERRLLAPVVTWARAPDGTLVIATTDWSDELAPEVHLGNHFVQDQLVAIDPTTFAPLRRVMTAFRSPRQDAAGGLDRGLSPLGIDVAPDGVWHVAFAGSDELARIAPFDPTLRTVDVAPLGLSAPCSAVALEGGTVAVSSPSSGRIVLLDREGRARRTIELAPSDRALLRDDPEALRRRYGERGFYEGTRAGISCQSCHLHGESDGLMHNIGGRELVPTLDARGVRGTAPYLRDGSYPRLADLHEVADTLYRGFREPAGDRGATLEAWLSSRPPPLPLGARDATAERLGLDVFVRAGCPTCHAPPAMTNLGRHPIGSVFPRADAPADRSLDTPSLRSVSRRGRYLFDGRAATLASIFGGAEDDRHGRIRALSERELDDLVRFLESL